jgi:hypothetical protein
VALSIKRNNFCRRLRVEIELFIRAIALGESNLGRLKGDQNPSPYLMQNRNAAKEDARKNGRAKKLK